MNTKLEALFYTLSGYAKEIIDTKDMSLDGIPYKMANDINKYFKKHKSHLNKSYTLEIVNILKKWDIEFQDRRTSPSILLILTMYYLICEANHKQTLLRFGHYRSDVIKLFNGIENSKYKEHLYNHIDLVDKFVQ